MATVTIHQFVVYNIAIDNFQKSRRWGTEDAIEVLTNGIIMPGTALEVDESVVQSEIPGLTMLDYNPHWTEGFQKEVKKGY